MGVHIPIEDGHIHPSPRKRRLARQGRLQIACANHGRSRFVHKLFGRRDIAHPLELWPGGQGTQLSQGQLQPPRMQRLVVEKHGAAQWTSQLCEGIPRSARSQLHPHLGHPGAHLGPFRSLTQQELRLHFLLPCCLHRCQLQRNAPAHTRRGEELLALSIALLAELLERPLGHLGPIDHSIALHSPKAL